MPYPHLTKRCKRIILLLGLIVIFISNHNCIAQIRWDGEAGDGQWNSALNWVGNNLPAPTDNVLLDNSIISGNYTVTLQSSATVKTISITPTTANSIQLIIPSANINSPAITTTGAGYTININSGAVLINSSGLSSMYSIALNDSMRIASGGQYIHNTRSAHAALATGLSKSAGTETGIFKFDVPGGGYTVSLTNHTYGTLVLSADASGGSQVYSSSAASPLTINGDFILQTGTTLNLNFSAATTIFGNYKQEGGVFNLASAAKNNTVNIKGDFIQKAGIITETSTGLPGIELNGSSNQNIQLGGTIINSVDFRINNSAGVSLLSPVSLPYNLGLINGIVHSNSFLTTLQGGCTIQADSATNKSFISGPLRKEGLSSGSYFLFPVGKSINQRWLELKNANGNYTVEFFKSNPKLISTNVGAGIHHTSSIEYWFVQPDDLPLASANIELSFNDVNSGGVTDMATLKVAQLTGNVWVDKANTSTTGSAGAAGSVVSNTINMFDNGSNIFTLASSDAFQNPLPLKLISFIGNTTNSNNEVLNWVVAGSWQPRLYEIQYSDNSMSFSTLSKIEAVYGQTAYTYTDKRKVNNKIYYRLKIFEDDSTVFYSNTIIMKGNSENKYLLKLQPSIVLNNSNLIIDALTDSEVKIDIYNMESRLMATKHVLLHTGANSIALALQWLTPGVYTVSVTSNDGSINVCRFVKMG